MAKQKKIEADLSLPDALPQGFVYTDPAGLGAEEVRAAEEAGKTNKAPSDGGKSVLKIIADNTFTLFNLLNILLAAALFAVGAYRNMLFLGVVVSNTLIGIVQELRAKQTVEKLKLLNESPCRAVRDGQTVTVPPAGLVEGDIITLRSGDQIPADAIVREGACTVCEALLTGEQDDAEKEEGSWLYSGSYVTGGVCRCQIVYAGERSYINRLSRSAKKIKAPASKLLTDLRRIIRTVSFILIPIGILLFCKQYFLMRSPLDQAVSSSVASMIGMIPEGLILLVSVALTVGVIRLAAKKTLVQQLYGIETLARVDTLCLDKTGTLTTGKMALEKLLPADGVSEDELRGKLSVYLGAAGDISSPTAAAIAAKVKPAQVRAGCVLPFTSERKYGAVSFPGLTLVLGAPSFIYGDGYGGRIKETVAEHAVRGARVVMLCECDGKIEGESIPPVSRALGFCLLSDELKADAPECMEYFKEQGVDVKVISGDDPLTVSKIAEEAGVTDAGKYIDASTLSGDMTEAAALEYAVFGRVTPDRKKKLIEALKDAGRCTAMTGDGVNDIPALKTSDCSVAMASGADAARRCAHVVLLDNNFSDLPRVVYEGRRVINNISRTASLFLVKTCYSFALSLLILFLPASYPFQPIQLTLISTLTVGMPSFFLALEPDKKRVGDHFLRNIILNALPGGIAVTVCAATASMLSSFWPSEATSTIATVSAGISGLAMLLSVCMPFSPLRAAVFAAMCVLFTAAVLFFGSVFFLVPLSGAQLIALAGISAAGVAIVLALKLIFKKIFRM